MRNGSEFTVAVRRGRRAGRRTLVVHLSRTSSTEAPTKVGFVVSKAVGSAVVRNRVKRQLRHLTRDRLASLPPGSWVVVRANPAAAGSTSLADDLDSALASLIRKEHVARDFPVRESLARDSSVGNEPLARGKRGAS